MLLALALGLMLLARLRAGVRGDQTDFFDIQTGRRGAQRHLFDLWLHPIEHENESRSLAVGDVELLALISINIQEESAAALVAVASVVHDEGVLPYVGGLHKAVLLVLVGQLGHARNPRILSAAAVHDQLCTLRLS